MSESLTWKPCRLREDDLLEKLKAADGDHNQSLRDLEDHLPQISCGGEAGALLVSPEIQSRYQKLLAGDSQNTSEGDVVILAPDPSKKELQSLEIVDLMRRNGGHLLKLGDLARLFPKAKLGGKGLPLEKLVADDIVLKTKQFPQGISLGESYVDPGGELIVSHLYQQELREN
ncbi:MAG: hypothetical protein HY073_00450, partial [Deltaproteobacteria bacterium]|nr:hypothetical protein [Deltaproteobacteria bacterium]